MEKTLKTNQLFRTVKAKTLATIISIGCAVLLPQLVHIVGGISNLGTTLGEAFLPMHFAIFMVGILAGPIAGATAGFISPLISFAITGMPSVVMLPFMMIELMTYGFVMGLLTNVKMPLIAKLLIAQITGRSIRAIAILVGVYALGSHINPSIIWTSICIGLPGLILQWTIIPLAIFYIDKKVKNE